MLNSWPLKKKNLWMECEVPNQLSLDITDCIDLCSYTHNDIYVT